MIQPRNFRRYSRLFAGLALAVFAAGPKPARAADLLYVSLGADSVVTYDVSLTDAQSIQDSVTLFARRDLRGINVLAFDKSGGFNSANSGNSLPGFVSVETFSNLAGTSTPNPLTLAFDQAGNLYATNSANGKVVRFDVNGTSSIFARTNMNHPFGLTFDASGNLYVANPGDSTISKFNSDGVFRMGWSTLNAPINTLTIPEPSTFVLGAIASGVMARLARRRTAGRG